MTTGTGYLSPAQAATHLGVHRQQILTAINTRQLPATNLGRPGGRPYYRIHPDDLDSFIRARQTMDTRARARAH